MERWIACWGNLCGVAPPADRIRTQQPAGYCNTSHLRTYTAAWRYRSSLVMGGGRRQMLHSYDTILLTFVCSVNNREPRWTHQATIQTALVRLRLQNDRTVSSHSSYCFNCRIGQWKCDDIPDFLPIKQHIWDRPGLWGISGVVACGGLQFCRLQTSLDA